MRSRHSRTSKSETTMSTSDPAQLFVATDTDPRAATSHLPSGVLPGGVLDPVALARMANEFFTALPNSLDVPSSPLPAHTVPTDVPPSGSVTTTAPAAPCKHRPGLRLSGDCSCAGNASGRTGSDWNRGLRCCCGGSIVLVSSGRPPYIQRSERFTGGAKPQGEPSLSVRPANGFGKCATYRFQPRLPRTSEPAIATSYKRATQRSKPWQRVSCPYVFVS